MVEQKIKEMIQDQLGLDDVDLNADLQTQYDIDSIGILDFIMTVEETFEVQFDDADLENMKTVADVVAKVESLTNQ